MSLAVAGPTVSQILADYGAEVIKIERPQGGDIFRNVPGMGATMFLAVNRGKKSLVLDMKTPEGLKIFYELAKKCDVIVENLAPGNAEKMGVTYSRARKANPRIVYCKIESFGEGPYEFIPAFDPVLQAATGIMSTTGFPPNKYARAGVSIVDMSTGMHGAIATLNMLLEREKTGKGGLVRVSLYDSAAFFMSYWLARYDLTGRDTSPLGSTHIFGSPYNLFKSKEGKGVFIAVAGDEAWASLCKALSFDDLYSRKEYSSSEVRVANKEELESEVAKRISNIEMKRIEEKFAEFRVPFAKLNTARSLFEDPHFLARKLAFQYKYEGKKFRTTVNPAIVGGKRSHACADPPSLGQHTTLVLKMLKFSKHEIKDLEKRGIIKLTES